jgi:hypothetical protein
LLKLLKDTATESDSSGSPSDSDDLPPREILEALARLEEQGLLTPEMLEHVGELAKKLGLRIGE